MATEAAAGAMYAGLLSRLRQAPEVAGYAHCHYINRQVAPPGSARLKQGLLNIDGTSHAELVTAITKANTQIASPSE